MRALALAVVCLGVVSCGPLEVSLGASEGIPSIESHTEVTLSTTTCGSTFEAEGATVTTTPVAAGCQVTVTKSVQVIDAASAQRLPSVGTGTVVQRVELAINTLRFVDTATGATLSLAERVTSLTLSLDGNVVADKAALTTIPTVITVRGAALAPIEAALHHKTAASVVTTLEAVLPTTPALPAKLSIDASIQPTVVVDAAQLLVL